MLDLDAALLSARQGRCAGVSPRLFFTLAEHGLDTLTVLWHSALNSALFRVPDRLLVLVAASHEPQGPNLYLQSPGMEGGGVAKEKHRGHRGVKSTSAEQLNTGLMKPHAALFF